MGVIVFYRARLKYIKASHVSHLTVMSCLAEFYNRAFLPATWYSCRSRLGCGL